MKLREEIDSNYKWDLSSYVQNEEVLNENMKWLENNISKFKSFYGKLSNKSLLKEYLDFSKEFSLIEDRLAVYINHNLNTDISNPYFLNLKQRFEFLGQKSAEATAFISPQLHELDDEYLKELIADNELYEYHRSFESILRSKPHKVDEKTNELLSKMSMFLDSTEEIRDTLCDSEIEYEDAIDSNNEKHAVNHSNYSLHITSADRVLRKSAFNSLMTGYEKKNKTLSIAMSKMVAQDIFDAKLTNFKSCLEEALFYEEVSPVLYNKLIEKVSQNTNTLQELVEKRRQLLKLDTIAFYDLYVPIMNSNEKYSIEQANQMVLDAVKPLGQEYCDYLIKKFTEKSIDYLPNKDKVSGAYSCGAYDAPSIVLMNFENNIESVYTLAHELGHSIHTELTNHNQPYGLSNYTIFSAEVASITNEILMFEYLLKNAKNKDEKQDLILDLLDKFRTTVFRQTMFAEFEQFTHETMEAEKPLTYVELNKKYYDLNKKYYGDKIDLPKVLEIEWSMIPHFYSSYYVYKYATGFITALAIVQNLKSNNEYYKKYINFLKSGQTKPSVELLQDIGVDLTSDNPYDSAFDYMKQLIKML